MIRHTVPRMPRTPQPIQTYLFHLFLRLLQIMRIADSVDSLYKRVHDAVRGSPSQSPRPLTLEQLQMALRGTTPSVIRSGGKRVRMSRRLQHTIPPQPTAQQTIRMVSCFANMRGRPQTVKLTNVFKCDVFMVLCDDHSGKLSFDMSKFWEIDYLFILMHRTKKIPIEFDHGGADNEDSIIGKKVIILYYGEDCSADPIVIRDGALWMTTDIRSNVDVEILVSTADEELLEGCADPIECADVRIYSRDFRHLLRYEDGDGRIQAIVGECDSIDDT